MELNKKYKNIYKLRLMRQLILQLLEIIICKWKKYLINSKEALLFLQV